MIFVSVRRSGSALFQGEDESDVVYFLSILAFELSTYSIEYSNYQHTNEKLHSCKIFQNIKIAERG